MFANDSGRSLNPAFSSAILKDGLLDMSGPSVRKAVKRLNHQAKRRDRKADKGSDWKK